MFLLFLFIFSFYFFFLFFITEFEYYFLDFAAHKHGCNLWCRCVESGKIQRVPVIRVCNCETVSSHSNDNQLCLDTRDVTIPHQRILRMLGGCIRFAIREYNECVNQKVVFDGVLNGKNAICCTKVHGTCGAQCLVKRHSTSQLVS